MGDAYMHFVTVDDDCRLRVLIEQTICNHYAASYGACIQTFAPRLVAAIENDRVICAAGLRTAADGFFSESYLSRPAESIVSACCGRPAARSGLLEVTSLCSASPAASVRFIHEIARQGLERGYEWSMFVATDRLQRLLTALGFSPIELAVARADRIANPAAWGSYYETAPRVMAVHRTAIAAALPQTATATGRAACAARSCELFLSLPPSTAWIASNERPA